MPQGGRPISGGWYNQTTYYLWANESYPDASAGAWSYGLTNDSNNFTAATFFVTTCAL